MGLVRDVEMLTQKAIQVHDTVSLMSLASMMPSCVSIRDQRGRVTPGSAGRSSSQLPTFSFRVNIYHKIISSDII